jgi:hypothetical protein
MPRYTTVEEQIDYGTSKIDPARSIEIPLRDLVQIYLTLAELIRFFHQPLHYPTLPQVERFLGTTEQGAVSVLHQLYYHKLHDVWPEDIARALDEGELNNPDPPYYYEATNPEHD